MKKKVLYFILLIILGLLVAYLIRYKSSTCICDSIPKNADAALVVKVRNLEKYFLLDMISDPMAYLGSKSEVVRDSIVETKNKDKNDSDQFSLIDYISMPKSILCYRTSKENNTWFSSEMNVKDIEKLNQHLSANELVIDDNNGRKVYNFNNQYVIINRDKIRLAYSKAPSDITDFSQSNAGYLSEGNALFDVLVGSDSDIIYADKTGQKIELNFESGEIKLDGQYHLDVLAESTTEMSQKGIGHLSTKLDVEECIALFSSAQKEKFSNFTKLDLDSLKVNWDGNLNAIMQGFTLSSDTIKTYEYDDDFNKIEVLEVNENVTPDFSMRIGLNLDGVNYMKGKNAIVEQDGADVLAIMPLARTYCESDKDGLNLYTKANNISSSSSSAYKLKLSVDLLKYLSGLENNTIYKSSYMEDLSGIKLDITNDDKVTGEITFTDNRNAIISIIAATRK